MSSKGKVYVKHLEQAKYVVKGKKLKTYIVTIKEKKASSNTQMNYIYKNIDVNNIDIYEEKSKNDYLQNNEQYSEVEFFIFSNSRSSAARVRFLFTLYCGKRLKDWKTRPK